jgi:5'-3' exonuclease
MILLFDADSLIFASCLKRKEEDSGEKFYTDIDLSIHKFEEGFMSIINHLEETYEINKVLVFSGSKGNFRKYISPKYKANRTSIELPPLLNEMHKFVKESYDSIIGYGVETDDMVARYWYNISQEHGRDNVMIISIDKDYRQFPALIYNYHYNHKCIYDISESEAMYNLYEQMIIGDGADNVQYCKGYGKKYAEKLFKDCDSHYKYTKRVYELFKKIHKGKAKQRYIECYNLLKLRTN